jgi:hypothetical protein
LHSAAPGGSSSGTATTSSSIIAARSSPLALQEVPPDGEVGNVDRSKSTSSAGIGGDGVLSGPIDDTANDIIVAQQMQVSEGTRMVNECGDAAVDVTKATSNGGTSAIVSALSGGISQSMDIDADVNSSGTMDTQHADKVTIHSITYSHYATRSVHIIGHDSYELTNFFTRHVSCCANNYCMLRTVWLLLFAQLSSPQQHTGECKDFHCSK